MTVDRANLRVIRFHGTSSETGLDGRLRGAVLPALAATAGIVEAWVGRRRTPEGDPERCIVAVTCQPDPLDEVLGEPPSVSELDPMLPSIELTGSIALPLAVAVVGDRIDPARVLRIVEGTARPGELPRYICEVEAGATSDVAAHHGPLRLYLAVREPDRFITVSTWADWADIEASTGSDARRPGATRHAELLASTEVVHFEMLPDEVPAVLPG